MTKKYFNNLVHKSEEGVRLTAEETLALYNYLNPSDFYIPNSTWERGLRFYRQFGMEKLFFKVGEHRLDILAEIDINFN